MLSVTRKPGECIYIVKVEGYSVSEARFLIREVRGSYVKVGIETDPLTAVYRSEIYDRIKPGLQRLRDSASSPDQFELAARAYLRSPGRRERAAESETRRLDSIQPIREYGGRGSRSDSLDECF